MIPERYLLNFQIALSALMANKIRSLLTALGIIFGVAAVIAMLAIGNGAQQEILEQIKLVGVNNIIIKPIVEQKEEQVEPESKKEKQKFSPGLTLLDVKSIKEVLPNIEKISPEIIVETSAIKAGLRRTTKLVGVLPDYFEISDFRLEKGNMFNANHIENGEQVCIIGKAIQTKFFSKEEPVGKYIKCGNIWLKVIGVLTERNISEKSISNLGIRDYNMDVYTPLKTMLIRFKNRSLITKSMLQGGGHDDEEEEEKTSEEKESYHQLDRLVIQVKNTDEMQPAAEMISRLLTRKHFKVVDFEITIPELLLKQQQRTKDIFNVVLGAIAGISLLVGGIGIMNIMLASVLERIKEIGLRMSIGATKKDIVLQFIIEAIMISISGGLIGVLLGVTLALIISAFAGIVTLISPFSIILSFGVSALVGLIFGIAPARKAAAQDPINCLRYE